MKKKTGRAALKIFVFALFAGYFGAYFLFRLPVLQGIISQAGWKDIAYSMLLYGAAPVVPAVITRLIFKKNAYKWLAVAATGLMILCVGIIVSGTEETIFSVDIRGYFAQYALLSSVPVLYCAAFWGKKREPWIALLPALAHFLSFFIQSALVYGAGSILAFLQYFSLEFVLLRNPDPETLKSMMTLLFMTIVFAAWAALCVFASRGLQAAVGRLQNGKSGKKKGRRAARR